MYTYSIALTTQSDTSNFPRYGSASTYIRSSGHFRLNFVKGLFRDNISNFYWNRFIFDIQGAKDKLAQFFETSCRAPKGTLTTKTSPALNDITARSFVAASIPGTRNQLDYHVQMQTHRRDGAGPLGLKKALTWNGRRWTEKCRTRKHGLPEES